MEETIHSLVVGAATGRDQSLNAPAPRNSVKGIDRLGNWTLKEHTYLQIIPDTIVD